MNGNSLLTVTGLLLYSAISGSAIHNENQIWVWKCDATNELCTRLPSQGNSNSETLYPSLEVCRLICGKYGSLWPQPTISTKISDELFMFPLSVIKFEFSIKDGEAKEILQGMTNIFLQLLSLEDTSSCPQTTNKVTIHITVNSDNISLDWSTNETYSLEVKTEGHQNSVQIISNTIYGARHALETLSQLTEFYPRNDGSTCLAMVDEVLIVDAPVYPHRGLLLDTARNFISVTSIKKHIDGMAASKLNVLHWHITDSQSFPLDLPNLPNMTKYGAYSADKIYHPNDIKELLSYAKLRGVRIIIEIDAPAHAGNGWQWGPQAGLGDLAVCINQQPFRSYCIEPPCGQLNPVNPNLYTILKVLYNDIINMLPKGEVFHMGGDEVYIPCWNSTPEIIKFIGDKPRTTETFLDLWSSYQAQALKAYDAGVGNTDTPIILWTSHLTEIDVIEKYLPKERYIIQTWVPAADNLPKNLLALGYKIIVSTKDTWYLDHGFWGSTVYHNWRVVYNNKIPRDYGVLGGEVCMWGEYVDETSVESRTWPRAAAAAERLWTDSSISVNVAAKRFYRHRERLVSRGINAEALIPRWCYQNEGQC